MSGRKAFIATAIVVSLNAGTTQQVLCQTAEPSAEATTLPEIVITAPSPIVKQAAPKPKKKSKPETVAAKPKPAPKTQAAAPEPEPAEPENSTPDTTELTRAPGTPLIAGDAFASVTVTTAREIEAKQGQTVTDTLATKPGINASSFAPGASRPIVRGLDNYRVRVQEDGIGTHDVSALSEDHAVPVDPNAADRIEVVRGPATLRYGSQAIGGVVAIENDRIPSFIPSGGFNGTIQGGVNSVDEGRDGAFKATAGSNGVAAHADGFKRQSEDYDTPQGTVANSFVDSEGGALGASFIGRDGYFGVALARVESLYGIPGEAAHIDLEQDKILSKGEWRMQSSGVEAVRFWFGASDYAHDEVTGSDVGSRFTNQEQEARFEVQHQALSTSAGELNGAAGIQWGHRNIRAQSFEGSSLLEPAETNSIAVFLFEELSVTPQLKLQAAGRIEQTDVDGVGLIDFSDPLNLVTAAGEKSFTPFGLSTGLLYEFSGGIVGRLTGQYVERAPDAAELFSQGLHEATGTFEIGNPNLTKEKASTIEFGLKKARGGFRFDASVFYTRYNEFISKSLTGVRCGDTIDTCGVEDVLDQLRFTQQDARFFGAEVVSQYDVARIWNGVLGIEGQYDFVNAEFDSGENVPRIPPHRLGGGLYYQDSHWFLRAGVLHAFEQDRIALNETPTNGYTLVSAEISYTTKLEASGGVVPEFTIGLKGENLADDDVRNHSSFKKDEVLQPGASARLFGSIKLN